MSGTSRSGGGGSGHGDGAPVRVRFCPAPSGWLHVGSVRAALFNYLHARHHGGTFVFRIEDTDASRATEDSMRSMMEALDWIGLAWGEGPTLEPDGSLGERGAHGPYRQSARGDLYAAVARRLEAAGALYRDYRTIEELEAWRDAARAGAGEGPPVVKASGFRHAPEEEARLAAEGRLPSLRLITPESGSVTIDDLVRGEVTWDWAQVSDPIVVRSDGSTTYPLANAVDDVAQGISLICRGEDLLSVTPRQLVMIEHLLTDGLIDEALAEVGLPPREAAWTRPSAYAHLPMVVGMDRKKLSKRHGSVSVQEFRRQGFLPEALRNHLALLGWAAPGGRERLDDAELIAAFDLGAVGRSAAAFDVDKLTAFNGERIRGLAPDDLAERLLPFLDGTEGGAALIGRPPSAAELATVRALVPLVQERMQRLDEVEAYAAAFLVDEVEHDPDAVAAVLASDEGRAILDEAAVVLGDADWDEASLEAAVRALAERRGVGLGKVAQPIRVAVSGGSVSPPIDQTLAILGRQETIDRLRRACTFARG